MRMGECSMVIFGNQRCVWCSLLGLTFRRNQGFAKILDGFQRIQSRSRVGISNDYLGLG